MRRIIMIKKLIFIVIGITLLAGAAGVSIAGEYNFIAAQELEKRIKQGPSLIIVDICPVEQFAKGHVPGSIETNAYPVKTDEERERLDKVMPKITSSTDDVVIVCPRGAGGKENL